MEGKLNTIILWGIVMDALFLCLLAWCSVSDIRKRTVSNCSIILLLCLGLTHMGYILLCSSVWWQYPAGLLLAIPFFILWLRNKMGAGDVKLIAAVAFYLGLPYMIVAFFLMALILAVLLVWSWFKHKSLKQQIPLAPVISAGAAGVILIRYLM